MTVLQRCERAFDHASREGLLVSHNPNREVLHRLGTHAGEAAGVLRSERWNPPTRSGTLTLLCSMLYGLQICLRRLRFNNSTVSSMYTLKNAIFDRLVLWPVETDEALVEVARASDNPERWLSIRVECPSAHYRAQYYHWPMEEVSEPVQAAIARRFGSWPPEAQHEDQRTK